MTLRRGAPNASRSQADCLDPDLLGCTRRAGVYIRSGAGRLFVVRVAGNILEEDGLASLEYAAQFLGSTAIFVLGHQNCGAVDAAIKVVKDNATLPGTCPA